jgi:hypothetical protein
MQKLFSFFSTAIILVSCSNSEKTKTGGYTDDATTLFSKVSSNESGIDFKNEIRQTIEFNFMNYMYIYTGAGVAIGDIDNDGLEDIYFASNFDSNALFKNEGDLKFKDITTSSNTADNGGFSTGVTMLDVNNDGWLDIYVCKAGSLGSDELRRNRLYVNQKDGSFKEDARSWGLDDPGYSTQAYTLDYDKDGDLDIYLVNHRYDFVNNTKISSEIQKAVEETTTDHLYRNDGDKFTKVTQEAGLVNKAWGLSAVVSDFNEDGWEDIYIANDFLEPDVMYINQKDGTFKNEILTRIDHISTNSMGSDYADLNNDLYPDLITVDMLSENYARSKENMASMSTSNFEQMVRIGYHHAYMANMLHFNTGNGEFKETSQLSGITKTDWSWAPLIADFDNDGFKDLFVTNGVDRDYTNQDAQAKLYEIMRSGKSMQLQAVLDMIPTERIDNYIFKNNGDLTFSKMIKEWGLEDPGYSNGAAFADLDNDGDLDLVTNNLYDNAGVYRNNSNNNYLQLKLEGSPRNPLAIGAKVYLKTEGSQQIQEQYITRGFESSVSPVIHFGLGNNASAGEVIVEWPDKKISQLADVSINKRHTVSYDQAIAASEKIRSATSLKESLNNQGLGIDYQHKENAFNDFSLQLLIPQKQSTKGTGIVTADVNGDDLDDFFVGNAAGAAAALYIQRENGTFMRSNESLFEAEAKYEDANALFLDSDNDGDLDLYVVSAGYELPENSALLQDRLYLNNGTGEFTRAAARLPKMLTSGKAVVAMDYDGDGDTDLFVGGNVVPGKYPVIPRSYLLMNDGGKFIDVSDTNESLMNIGMVSDATFTDYDGDDDMDLLVVGEWMKPTFFRNDEGVFTRDDQAGGLDNTEGWWFSVTAADFDGDGDDDYMLGNLGRNNKFQPDDKKPLYIYAKDFDNNGSFDVALSKINDGKLVPVRGKECSSEQNPFLLDKIQSYKEFASLDMNQIYGEESLEEALNLVVYTFESAYIENLGDGNFAIEQLPMEAQTGPTLSMATGDFNKDGNLDIIGIGAIYDAEVETIRYDGNYGYTLLGDGQGGFTHSSIHDPFIDSDAKDMTQITINGRSYFMVVSNNAPLEIFSFTSPSG